MEKDFYSPKEVAKILSVDYRTILYLITSKKLEVTNLAVGTRPLYRISHAQLQNLIKNKKPYGTRNT